MQAVCMLREGPHYRREAFVAGLKRAGYALRDAAKPADARDVLVIWNRYGRFEDAAKHWESYGGTVLVCENGYCGKDADGRQHYAIARDAHNGAGWFPVGDVERFYRLGLEVAPWQHHDGHLLICGQRGIGNAPMASPPNWHSTTEKRFRGERSIKVRPHPGRDVPKPLAPDLEGAWACAIWSSGCGVQALLAGIPVLYAAPRWICEDGARRLNDLSAVFVDDAARLKALTRMAWGQWSLAEIDAGEPFVRLMEMRQAA